MWGIVLCVEKSTLGQEGGGGERERDKKGNNGIGGIGEGSPSFSSAAGGHSLLLKFLGKEGGGGVGGS